LFGCFAGSAIFLTLSFLFPARESFVEETILALEDDDLETKQVTDDDRASDGGYGITDKGSGPELVSK
jgi:hypothetical protein